MPLKSAQGRSKKSVNQAISYNLRELSKDNKKSGKEKGASGKPRSRQQMLAIAISAAKRSKRSGK
jgi:hypothetical protein